MPTYIKIKIRRDSTENWESVNPVLDMGELGADMTKHGLKVGNGLSNWTELPFCSPEIVNDLVTGGATSALSAEMGVELKQLVDSKPDATTVNTLIQSSKVTVEDQNWSSTSTTNALSANSGRVLKNLLNGKADQSALNSLQTQVNNIITSGGTTVVDSLTSTSPTSALSANQGRVLKDLVDAVSNQVTNLNNQVNGLGMFGMGYTINSWNAYDKPTKITFEDGVTATLTWTGQFLQRITASTGEVMTLNYDGNGRITGRTITRS
ncbi:MAG: hypothetical protein IJS28_07400 [Synergistaceae bacterium]|nr:hypothetical protein [Synergistaceae bacterium]